MTAAAKLPSAVVLIATIVACGDRDDPAATASQQRLAACQTSATALCARVATCSPLYIRFFFETVPDCEAMVTDACVARYSGAGASPAPRACATEAANATCEVLTDPQRSLFFATPPSAVLRACPVTAGAFDDHAPCVRDGDCKSGACGELIPGGGKGCTPQRHIGETCRVDNGVNCEALSTCAGGHCALLAPSGPECSDAAICASGSCVANRCAPLLGEGEACDKTTPTGACDLPHGLVCADDGRCRALAIVDPGETCDPLYAKIPEATARLCDARAVCSESGTCTAAPKRGEPCTGTCRIGLTCEGGRCVTDTR